MPTHSDDLDQTTAALLAELRELCTDVTSDPLVRNRRLAVLRRLERCARDGRRSALAVA